MALKENYKDDILDTSQNVKRKYQMENNGDGTVSFTDVTEYTQQGDSFGASDMNATNSKVNALETDIGEINDNLSGFKYYPIGTAIVGLVADGTPYTDANGNYILAQSTTGQSMIDGVTYKSINSTEDTRGEVGADTATPFRSGILMGSIPTFTDHITINLGFEPTIMVVFDYTSGGYNGLGAYVKGVTNPNIEFYNNNGSRGQASGLTYNNKSITINTNDGLTWSNMKYWLLK